MAIVALLACGLPLAAGCSGRAGTFPDAGSAAEPLSETEHARCELGEPVSLNPPDVLRDPCLVRGPDGPRVLGYTQDRSLFWSDGARTGLSADGTLGAPDRTDGARMVAWTGAAYLVTDGVSVTARNSTFTDAVTLRTALPGGACEPSLVEMAGRAMITWRRAPRGGTCDEGGAAWIQVLGPSGDPLGAARVMSPLERNLRVGPVHARWDFGRVVLDARDMDIGASRYWVLDPSGAELTRGTAGRVACPRSGCVQVRAVSEAAGSGVDGAAQVIRLDPLDGAPGFSTSAVAVTVSAVAVSGDRVLVLHPEGGDAMGCRATVIDVARHSVVLEFSDEGLACDDARVRPTPSGFRVLLHDVGRDLPRISTRTITCVD